MYVPNPARMPLAVINPILAYAPVTILENEDPESNYEDNHSESEDTGNGMRLRCARHMIVSH